MAAVIGHHKQKTICTRVDYGNEGGTLDIVISCEDCWPPSVDVIPHLGGSSDHSIVVWPSSSLRSRLWPMTPDVSSRGGTLNSSGFELLFSHCASVDLMRCPRWCLSRTWVGCTTALLTCCWTIAHRLHKWPAALEEHLVGGMTMTAVQQSAGCGSWSVALADGTLTCCGKPNRTGTQPEQSEPIVIIIARSFKNDWRLSTDRPVNPYDSLSHDQLSQTLHSYVLSWWRSGSQRAAIIEWFPLHGSSWSQIAALAWG